RFPPGTQAAPRRQSGPPPPAAGRRTTVRAAAGCQWPRRWRSRASASASARLPRRAPARRTAARSVFQLVGLVKDDRAELGQDAGVRRALGLLPDREVGEEQMMIDDDDVALGRAAMHLGDEAAVELLALLADAGVGARVEFGPELIVFRQQRELGPVAGFRGPLPVGDHAKLLDLIEPAQDGLFAQRV